MKYVYDELNKIENLSGKLKFNDSHDCITININEYLHLIVSDNMIELNDTQMALTHWHPVDDEDIIQDLTEIAKGDVVFIEDSRWFSFHKIDIMSKERFEKVKEKYLSQKHLRIYTGVSIIKRNTK